jgi:hypothetical protein
MRLCLRGSGRMLLDSGPGSGHPGIVMGSQRFDFGGDSGYGSHPTTIGGAFGPFELAREPRGR